MSIPGDSSPNRADLTERRRKRSNASTLLPLGVARPRSSQQGRGKSVHSGFFSDVRTKLRAHKMRVTAPRLKMLRTLADSPSPLSVEGLHKAIADQCDLVTVYRSIRALHEIGLVRKLYAFDGTVLYMSASGPSAYCVLPKHSGPGMILPLEVAADFDAVLRRATEYLKAAGYQNVQPVLQFFGDREPA